MKRSPRLFVPLALTSLALATASCGTSEGASGDGPTPTSHVVAIDVSRSAAQAQIEDLGISTVAERMRDLDGNGAVRVLAFDSSVGQSPCRYVQFDLPWENNSTQLEDDKRALMRSAPAKLDEYLTCVKDEAEGQDRLTDVFGSAVASAQLIDSSAEVRTLDIITDGCHTLDPEIATCSPVVEDATWRSETIAALPPSDVPDLTDVDVTISGLGIGANTQQSTIDGLRQFMTEYFDRTGAKVSIR